MFFYSPNPAWIPDYCLTGPDKKTLYIQEEDGKGNYTGYLTPFLDWVLNAYHVEKGQVGLLRLRRQSARDADVGPAAVRHGRGPLLPRRPAGRGQDRRTT